jgi:hypothetical protein
MRSTVEFMSSLDREPSRGGSLLSPALKLVSPKSNGSCHRALENKTPLLGERGEGFTLFAAFTKSAPRVLKGATEE